MPLEDLAFYVAVGSVFAIAGTNAVHNWLLEGRREFATIYTMLAVLAVFVLINYD
jgi:hypothetical protein